MSEDKKPFVVKDRRHFTAEGQARGEDSSRDEPKARPAPVVPAEPAPPPEPAAPPPDPRRDAGPGPALDFAGLLISLATQASLLLGMAGEDEEGAPPDLAGAQAIITLLEVLREKTEGRRTEDEERVLQGVLYELRMAYVSRTRTGGA
jgi:hypothetical protein